ncbi:MAG TPA: endonuclease/exonuclease/phosphatase family protein [Acidimicrobiales bacterium]
MPATGATIRVATLNLLNHPNARWREREPLVVDQARAIDADVYAFQEVDASGDQVERIRKALGDEYLAVTLANPDPASIKSLAMITRLPVLRRDACTDMEQGDIALRIVVEAAVGAHCAVTTTHFHYEASKAGSECRRRQAEQLAAWVGKNGGRMPNVVLGDFNTSPEGAAATWLRERFDSAYAEVHGDEPEWTHPTDLIRTLDWQLMYGQTLPDVVPRRTVDYVFVDQNVEVDDCRMAWTEPSRDDPQLFPSDHYGLVADLRLP